MNLSEQLRESRAKHKFNDRQEALDQVRVFRTVQQATSRFCADCPCAQICSKIKTCLVSTRSDPTKDWLVEELKKLTND